MLDRFIEFFTSHSLLGTSLIMLVTVAWNVFKWLAPDLTKWPPKWPWSEKGEMAAAIENRVAPLPAPATGPVFQINMPAALQPKIHLTGRNRWSGTADPNFMGAFGIAFIAFWCTLLLIGFVTSFHEVDLDFRGFLFLIPFALVVNFMLYSGFQVLLHQLAMAFGTVRIIATSQVAVMTLEIFHSFSQSIVVEADEFRFEEPFFVERKNGDKWPLRQRLPERVKTPFFSFLSEHWK